MFKLFRTFLLILFLVSTTTAVYSETSWISKKSDKTKVELKKEKKEKIEKKKKWIAKKKENKKKLKEKIKESKSWITKKSKEKIKEIKKNLKKHRNIDNLPKAELYFAARIEPNENQEALYLYGYINSNKKSDKSKKFKFNNTYYYSLNDGIAFFDDGKTTCQADFLKGVLFEKTEFEKLKGEIIITCKKKKITAATIDFEKNGKSGNGNGPYTNGSKVEFEFYTKKNEAIAKLDTYKEDTNRRAALAFAPPVDPLDINPTGKYYALLIGNANYATHGKWANLKSPINDITEIGNILKQKYKFEKVITIKNANRKKIFKGFNDISKLSTDNDYVLIYYSGHGDIRTNQSYWIPIDGEKEFGFGDWVNINDIQNYIKKGSPNEILARHLAIMSDSCYFAVEEKGNKLLSNKTKAYNKLLMRKARIIVASGSNEPVEDTGQDKHSMFGMSFIQSLRNNDDVIKMQDIVTNIIFAHAGMSQQPYGIGINAWGHGGGDFLFVVKKQIK